MRVDLVISNIGQLVTCATTDGKPKRAAAMRDVGLIENAALAITDGRISAIGSISEIERTVTWNHAIDAGGDVVCPGFVDPHTHIVFAGNRINEFELKIKGADYLEILAGGGGILSTVQRTREASFETLVELGRTRLDRMLTCGTTTAEVKTGYGLDTDTELRMLRVIEELDRTHEIDLVPTFLPAHAVPSEYRGDTDKYVDLVCDDMLPKAWVWYERSHFVDQVPFFVDVFCEDNAFDFGQSVRVLEAAKAIGFAVKAHVDEFTNLGCGRTAIELGATSIDHLDQTSYDEIKLLAESATIGVITPTVNFNFGSMHFADARRLVDSGCSIAISTDYNPGSAPCPSQPMAMAIACRYQKLLPAEALNAATINAAYACGVADDAGSLEVGKRADVLILGTKDFRETAYEFGSNLIRTVIKNGEVVRKL
jgi:imidazolonepropionase